MTTDPPHDPFDPMIDEFLDCTGKLRKFRLGSFAGGSFLEAVELIDGDPVGLRFVMKMDEHGELPWGAMRKKIRARMAERDLAVNPKTRQLEILRGSVRAQIDSIPDEPNEGPVLLVDDRKITWHELGRMLEGLEGWRLRLEILDHDEA